HQKQGVNESPPIMPPTAESDPSLIEVQETIIVETLEKAINQYLLKKDEVVDTRVEKAAESYINSLYHPGGGRASESLDTPSYFPQFPISESRLCGEKITGPVRRSTRILMKSATNQHYKPCLICSN
ncbi:hypothetical protein MKX03_025933, partial [Papaver bracteatum]